MQYRNLGNTGLRVSRVCLGMMSYGRHEDPAVGAGEAEAEPIIRTAVEGGITFFDTADVYNGGRARSSPAGCSRSCSERVRSTSSRPR